MEKNKPLISLPEINLDIYENEFAGISGPTGCGKTSILNKIYQECHQYMDVSYVFQESRLLPDISVEKNIQLVNSDCEKWLKLFDIYDFKNRKAGLLSGGEAQRVNLARAFAWDGQLYLLDEPFSAQDEMHKQLILDLVKQVHLKGRTVVMVSHDKSTLKSCCDKMAEIEDKQLFL